MCFIIGKSKDLTGRIGLSRKDLVMIGKLTLEKQTAKVHIGQNCPRTESRSKFLSVAMICVVSYEGGGGGGSYLNKYTASKDIAYTVR